MSMKPIEVLDVDELFSEVTDHVMKLHERSYTRQQIENATWKIWGHCRRNADNLNSEEHCRLIKETIVGAVADVQKRIEGLRGEICDAKKKTRMARKIVDIYKDKLAAQKKRSREVEGQMTGQLQRNKVRHKKAVDKLNDRIKQIMYPPKPETEEAKKKRFKRPLSEEEFEAKVKAGLAKKAKAAVKLHLDIERNVYDGRQGEDESADSRTGGDGRSYGVAGKRDDASGGRVLDGSDSGDREPEVYTDPGAPQAEAGATRKVGANHHADGPAHGAAV